MANLIKNGDFSQQGTHWTASNPGNVSYDSGDCVIAQPGSISQEVLTANGQGGSFMVSARMKTILGSAGRVTVQPIPSGTPVFLDVPGAQEWIVKSTIITAPTATIAFKVTLAANDGESGKPGSYFADLTLSKLN
ncbi:hypothetical protein C2E19_16275 [Pseudomonas sp. DTU12.3]|uniref:hypothetical protein n=1 Tax=Pseudomonas sp. DTU12.3 TaxID=2073078 RepID=UPI00101078A8|nr:hypothetical protein [Pseudomonas sp. DTU12.3]QAX85314.1 hypothetical protein C2E19_16275 [Pseudomonas sp. DTU12.3]